MAFADIQPINAANDHIAIGGDVPLPDHGTQQESSVLSPDQARQAVWVAEQLRALLESRVVLECSQEMLNLVYSRCNLLCKHARLHVPQEIEQDFFKAVVDEVLGFGHSEPLVISWSDAGWPRLDGGPSHTRMRSHGSPGA